MDNNARAVIRRVLRAAARLPHFFDLSDGERVSFLIARAYRMGMRDAAHRTRRKTTGGER